jgi:hypothetical protein
MFHKTEERHLTKMKNNFKMQIMLRVLYNLRISSYWKLIGIVF